MSALSDAYSQALKQIKQTAGQVGKGLTESPEQAAQAPIASIESYANGLASSPVGDALGATLHLAGQAAHLAGQAHVALPIMAGMVKPVTNVLERVRPGLNEVGSLTPQELQNGVSNQFGNIDAMRLNNIDKGTLSDPAQAAMQSIYRTEPQGYHGTDDMVARERFNLPQLTKIGAGSDRHVYDLGNGQVLKIAKSARGLAQNASEGDMYAPVPEVSETGKNYVVAEKVNPPDARTKDFVKTLQSEWNPMNHFSETLNKVASIYENKGDEELAKIAYDLQNYDPMMADLGRIKNWGTDKNGLPILQDAGALNNRTLSDYRGTTNMSDPDFRSAVLQSRAAKQKFGDLDKNKMYGLAAGGAILPLALQRYLLQQPKKPDQQQ